MHFKVDLIAHVYMYNMFFFIFMSLILYLYLLHYARKRRAETNAVLFPCTPFVEMTVSRKDQIFQTGVIQMIPLTQNHNYDENISHVLIVEDTIW